MLPREARDFLLLRAVGQRTRHVHDVLGRDGPPEGEDGIGEGGVCKAMERLLGAVRYVCVAQVLDVRQHVRHGLRGVCEELVHLGRVHQAVCLQMFFVEGELYAVARRDGGILSCRAVFCVEEGVHALAVIDMQVPAVLYHDGSVVVLAIVGRLAEDDDAFVCGHVGHGNGRVHHEEDEHLRCVGHVARVHDDGVVGRRHFPLCREQRLPEYDKEDVRGHRDLQAVVVDGLVGLVCRLLFRADGPREDLACRKHRCFVDDGRGPCRRHHAVVRRCLREPVLLRRILLEVELQDRHEQVEPAGLQVHVANLDEVQDDPVRIAHVLDHALVPLVAVLRLHVRGGVACGVCAFGRLRNPAAIDGVRPELVACAVLFGLRLRLLLREPGCHDLAAAVARGSSLSLLLYRKDARVDVEKGVCHEGARHVAVVWLDNPGKRRLQYLVRCQLAQLVLCEGLWH